MAPACLWRLLALTSPLSSSRVMVIRSMPNRLVIPTTKVSSSTSNSTRVSSRPAEASKPGAPSASAPNVAGPYRQATRTPALMCDIFNVLCNLLLQKLMTAPRSNSIIPHPAPLGSPDPASGEPTTDSLRQRSRLTNDPRPVSVSATGEPRETVLLDRRDSISSCSSQSVVRPPTRGRGSGIPHRAPSAIQHHLKPLSPPSASSTSPR